MVDGWVKRIIEAVGAGKRAASLNSDGIPESDFGSLADYNQLKLVFDKAFALMEINFSKEHPDKYYLSKALKFKLPGSEQINIEKQEITFSTYNTLFARTACDYLQRNDLADGSVNVLTEPVKVTLIHLNKNNIQKLHEQSLQHLSELKTPERETSKFVDRLEAEQSNTSTIKR